MKIRKASTANVKKCIRLKLVHNHVAFEVYLYTHDGSVVGSTEMGFHTAYLAYFNLPIKTREKHFEQIKSYVEKYIR